MPVYNGEKYVEEAVRSVLNQSYPDFELLVADDGSTDRTLEIVRSFTDPRIVVMQRAHDFIGTLNAGLERASAPYIARMDADDVMQADRLKIQVGLMEEDPEIAVCGSWVIPFGKGVSRGRVLSSFSGYIRYPVLELLKGNILFHPTVMMRKSFLETHRLRYEPYAHAEDYKLWFDAARCGGRIYVEPQPLLYYRVSEKQVTRQKSDGQADTTWRIKREILSFLIGRAGKEAEILERTCENMLLLKERGWITEEDLTAFFYGCLEKVIRESE